MKTLFHYINIIGIIFYLASCSSRSQEWEKLQDVETYIHTHADSALVVLQNIQQSSLSNKEEKAKHALLLSMALDKNVIDRTDFEVLQPAIDYYRNHGTATDKLRTLYYEGRIFTNQNDYASASIRFNQALNKGKESDDIRTKARIHFAQANIYNKLYQYDKYTEENKQASEYFKEAGLLNSYANCLKRIINGYNILEDQENAKFYIQQFKNILDSVNAQRKMDFYNVHLIHVKNNSTKEETASALNEYLENVPEKDWDNLSLADAYLTLDDYQKAYDCLQNHKPSSDIIRFYAVSIKVFQQLNQPEKELDAYRNYTEISDSIDLAIYAQSTQIMEEYHEQELEILQHKATQDKIVLVAVIAILVLSIICIGIYVRFKMNQKEKEKYRLQCLQIEQERDNLSQLLETQKEELSEEAKNALSNRLSLLNRFFIAHITNNESSNSKLHQEMEALIANRNTFMESTRLSFVASHPQFVQHLESHGLTEWEINYCCLYALGLKGKEVGTYIKMRSHYNVSSDIRVKLGISEHDTNLGIYLRKLLAHS